MKTKRDPYMLPPVARFPPVNPLVSFTLQLRIARVYHCGENDYRFDVVHFFEFLKIRNHCFCNVFPYRNVFASIKTVMEINQIHCWVICARLQINSHTTSNTTMTIHHTTSQNDTTPHPHPHPALTLPYPILPYTACPYMTLPYITSTSTSASTSYISPLSLPLPSPFYLYLCVYLYLYLHLYFFIHFRPRLRPRPRPHPRLLFFFPSFFSFF